MESSSALPAVDEIGIVASIQAAFKGRARPTKITDSTELSADELLSLSEIIKFDWDDANAEHWERYSDAINWLSREGFCYYLPSVMLATISERDPNLIAACSIFFMLDRTPSEELWDDGFRRRWGLLNKKELEAVEGWIYWMASMKNTGHDETSLTRALLTLDLLREKAGA